MIGSSAILTASSAGFGFGLMSVGTESDHGISESGQTGSPGSSALGVSLSSHCTYLHWFSSFILTVATIEYAPADASVPRGVSLSRKFLRQATFH